MMKNLKQKLIIFLCFLMIAGVSAFADEKQADKSLDIKRLRQTVEYKAGDLQDPFGVESQLAEEKNKDEDINKVVIPKELPKYTIQGIIWGSGTPQAIINGKIVRIGDKIDNAKVIAIDKEGVMVFFDNREFTIPAPAAGVTQK